MIRPILIVAALAGLPMLISSAALAAPAAIAEVITICDPVIAEEYKGDDSRWGTCVTATKEFLTGVYGPPATVAEPDSVTADLISELIKLYRPGEECKAHPTELPEAILAAASFSIDADQKLLLEQISASVKNCEAVETGAIVPVPAAPAVSETGA